MRLKIHIQQTRNKVLNTIGGYNEDSGIALDIGAENEF